MSDGGFAVSYVNGLVPPPCDVTDQQPSGRSYYRTDKCTNQQVLFFQLMAETSPVSKNVCLHSQYQSVNGVQYVTLISCRVSSAYFDRRFTCRSDMIVCCAYQLYVHCIHITVRLFIKDKFL